METVYQTKYPIDPEKETISTLAVTETEIERTLLSHPFFTAQPQTLVCDFLNLAIACNQLAAHANAALEIALFQSESVVTILLCAPSFSFGLRQRALWQKLCLLASNIELRPKSQITVSFDFSKTNDKLYSYFEPQK